MGEGGMVVDVGIGGSCYEDCRQVRDLGRVLEITLSNSVLMSYKLSQTNQCGK